MNLECLTDSSVAIPSLSQSRWMLMNKQSLNMKRTTEFSVVTNRHLTSVVGPRCTRPAPSSELTNASNKMLHSISPHNKRTYSLPFLAFLLFCNVIMQTWDIYICVYLCAALLARRLCWGKGCQHFSWTVLINGVITWLKYLLDIYLWLLISTSL
jgi:hypothetical protein